MFQPFQRSATSPTARARSGLAVARGFVEAMGGETDGRGHTGGGLTMVWHAAGVGVTRVLVVDDEPQIRRALRDQPRGTRL